MSTDTNSELPKDVPPIEQKLPLCKGCGSNDIFSDHLACQSMMTREYLVMPIFICKNCASGLILADNFKPFVTKLLEKLNSKNPIAPQPEKNENSPPIPS